jgi:hypothetical protein
MVEAYLKLAQEFCWEGALAEAHKAKVALDFMVIHGNGVDRTCAMHLRGKVIDAIRALERVSPAPLAG